MHIEKFKIIGLHGYIDKEIDFNSDLTLLVGINGSGKTSILNILNWIIKPSLPKLCVTEFKSINLTFSYKKTNYNIQCKHNRATFKYQISTDTEKFYPLSIPIKVRPCNIGNDNSLKENLIQSYTHLAPEPKEKKTWELISSFPNPTIIGLDRNLYTEESSERIYYEELHSNKIPRRNSNISPLDRVKEIVNREYRRRKNEVLVLTNKLKNHLILSTFSGSITVESFTSGIKYKLNLNQIENAEARVNDYFKNFESDVISESEQLTINQFFSQLKEITKRYQQNPQDETVKLLYGLNANQFVKVRRLLKEFENFETKSTKTLEEITVYLNTLNHFLKDSAKQILFKEDTSELTFNTLNKKGEITTKYKDIKFLSSGEQQILILFSYIAFNSQDGRIFIIDEPELSLHIKWQEDFLEMLEKITPDSTQLILATHSPILANKKKENAILLMPFND
jgi:predicted ATPase